MARKNTLPVNEPFSYEKLIDLKAEQLDSLIKECEINIDRLRLDIVKNYQQAQPYLSQMRILKVQLNQTIEKLEACKTFLSMEKNGSLVSNIDLNLLKKGIQEDEDEPESPQPPPPPSKPKPSSAKPPSGSSKTKFKSQTQPVKPVKPLPRSKTSVSINR